MLKPEKFVGSLVLQRYRLDEVLSSGGMGVLYRGTHVRTGRSVAIKFLLDREDNDRFALEARAAAELKHPNVVDVIDMDEDEDGMPFLVLELLEGKPLSLWLQTRPILAPQQALAWLLPIMGALSVAHDRGILHRDIKPANIFIACLPGGVFVPKLLDFGVAKVQSEPTLTRSGAVVGTPSYMSPEQARGDRELNAATDIWGMGVIWFRCLTGRLPFEHEQVMGTLMRIVNERAPLLEAVSPGLPRGLCWPIDRALQYDPAARHANMRAFALALLAGAMREGVPLPRDPDPQGLPDWQRWLVEQRDVGATGVMARPTPGPSLRRRDAAAPSMARSSLPPPLPYDPAEPTLELDVPGAAKLEAAPPATRSPEPLSTHGGLPSTRRPWGWIAASVIALATLAAWAVFGSSSGRTDPRPLRATEPSAPVVREAPPVSVPAPPPRSAAVPPSELEPTPDDLKITAPAEAKGEPPEEPVKKRPSSRKRAKQAPSAQPGAASERDNLSIETTWR